MCCDHGDKFKVKKNFKNAEKRFERQKQREKRHGKILMKSCRDLAKDMAECTFKPNLEKLPVRNEN